MCIPQFIETIKVKDGEFYNLPLHFERLCKTVDCFFETRVPTLELSEKTIPETLREGLVKCRVVYGSTIESIEFEAYKFKKISSLKIVEDNLIAYDFKSVDRDRLNRLTSQREDASEILIVKDGWITDTSYSNVVFENQSGLFTPRSYLLAGVKRRQLLDEGRIHEKEIRLDDLSSYSKVYLINALIDLEDEISIPISEIW